MLFLATAGLGACGDAAFVGPPVDAPFTAVTAGVLHSCGLTMPGDLYCWGWNRDGQLGDGSGSDRAVPVRVQASLSFTTVSAGGGHTCGVTSTSVPYCWGFNLSGQLGDGTTQTRRIPVQVSGALTMTELASGGAYTCGITTDSTGYCWGWGGTGQLGAEPTDVCPSGTSDDPCAKRPVLVIADLKFTQIAVGARHTCAVAVDSTAHCWGKNESGQLGNGSAADSGAPVPVSGGLKVVQLTVGFDHTCALTGTGEAYCWGANALGQLGDTAVASSAVPHYVIGGVAFASLTAGGTHTCAVSTLGAGFCWGANDFGQIGSEASTMCATAGGATIPCAREPQAVAGGHVFLSLSAGTHHTCGVTTERVAYCWGLNDHGQLGEGTRTRSTVPARVANQEAVP